MGANVSSGKGAGVFLTLFSLPFAAVGTVMAVLTVWTLLVYFNQQTWDTAPAIIKHAKLNSHRSSKSTTYSVEADYDYEYQGKKYLNASKVSQYSGSDNISTFHRKLYKKINHYKKSGKPYECFVNPSNPEDVVLNRDLRPMQLIFFSIFALVFGGAGYGLLFAGIRSIIGSKKQKKLEEAFPGQPWLQKDNWREGLIKATGKTMMIFSIIFAFFWNVVSFPIAVTILVKEAGKGDPVVYAVLLFPLIGLFLMIWAIVSILRWRKFGQSHFSMDSVPGVIGGKLSGKICTTVNIAPEEGFNLSLQCINRYVSGSGKNRSTHQRILWEEEQVIERELLYQDLTRSEIPVLFAIPYDQEATNEIDSNNSTIWKLKVTAAVPGLDYSAEFEIPVFMTDASDSAFELPKSELDGSPNKKVESLELLERAGIIVSPSYFGSGTRYLFPMGRNWKSSLGISLFAILWTGFAICIFIFKAPIFFLIIWCLVDLLVIIGALNSWLNRRAIDVDKYCIKLSGGFLGIGPTREIDVKDFERFEIKVSSQSNSVTFYRVKLHTLSNKTFHVVSGLKGKLLAEAFIKALMKDMEK